MQSLSLKFHLFVFVGASILLFGGPASAQEKPKFPSADTPKSKSPSPAAKQHIPPLESLNAADDPDKAGQTEFDKDSPDQIQKRDEWFYKQRSSINGHIPAGARLKAFQHMQRMMEAEGKLVRHADGTYSAAPPLTPQALATPQWMPIGPAPTTGGTFTPTSGRVTTIAVDPSDPTGNTVLIGAAQGGIWRSTDGGTTWTPQGDSNPSLAMGSIAFANPASPGGAGVVYAGTGEQASIGFDVYFGAGILKSTDYGQTWTQTCAVAGPTCPFIGPYSDFTFGFFSDGGAHISYVAVNPFNPNLVLVAAHIPQASVSLTAGGLFCSDNGGTSWSSVLTASGEMATFVGFANATTAYAALGRTSGSLNGAANPNGIYKSTNADGKGSAGALPASCANITFSNVTPNGTAGIPAADFGRIDVGIASADSTGNTVFASIADGTVSSRNNLGVFKTTDGGNTWTNTNAPDICSAQCWYDNVIKVDPNNSNIVFFGGGAHEAVIGNSLTFEWVIHSTDGGVTWNPAVPTQTGIPGLPHVDEHAMAFAKTSSGVRMYLGNDGGVWRTDDAEAATVAWTNLNNFPLQITQFYPGLSIHPSNPSIAYGGTQDNGSQNYSGSPIWANNGICGDGGWTLIDPVIPSTVYVLCQVISLRKSVTSGARSSFRPATTGINLLDPVNFIAPVAIDVVNSNRLYFATDKVYQSIDGANSWLPISGVLSPNANPQLSPAVITALAVGGGANGNAVYAGTSDGNVFIALDVAPGVGTLQQTTNQISLPPRTPTQIILDPSDPSGKIAYVTYSGFSGFGGDNLGHIFTTINGGITWNDVSCTDGGRCGIPNLGDLPNIPVNDLVIDPDLPGTLYVATDLGVFQGACTIATPVAPSTCSWSTLGAALPNVAVLSLKLHEPSRTLRAATHGRGVWELALGGVKAFALTSLSPVSANAGDPGLPQFTVGGSGFSASSQVLFTIGGTTTPLATTFISTAQLTAVIPSAALQSAGVAQVSVTDNAQTTSALPFTVIALLPTLTSVSPASTPVLSPSTSDLITVTGTNFTIDSSVILNPFFNGPGGKLRLTTTSQSSTSLTARIPASALGPFGSTNNVAVSTLPPGGGLSITSLPFDVLAPIPLNDNFSAALDLSALTSPDIRDTSSATTEANDPTPPCGQLGGTPTPPLVFGRSNTIWYKFTPTSSGTLNLDTVGANYVTWISVWTGASQAALTLVPNACSGFVSTLVIPNSLPNVSLTGGTTYYIMVGSAGPITSPGVTVIGNGLPPDPIAYGGKSVLNFSFVPNPDFAMTPAAPTSVTVSAGSPAVYTLAISASGAFASNVAVTCSLPAAATTCAASPASPAPGTNTTITVTTMAHQLLIPSRPFRRFGPWQRVVPILVLATLAALLLAFAARTRRQWIVATIPLACLFLFLVFEASGCNGSNNAPPPPHGTQPGTYTVTITGNSGVTTHTTTVTLIVQ